MVETTTRSPSLNTITTSVSQTLGPAMLILGLVAVGFVYHPTVSVETPELYVQTSRLAFMIMIGGLMTVFGHRNKFD